MMDTWIVVLVELSAIDNKYKAQLNAVRYLINLTCESDATELIKKALTTGKLSISYKTTSDEKISLAKQIVDIVAHESATDISRVEVEPISELISCQRKVREAHQTWH